MSTVGFKPDLPDAGKRGGSDSDGVPPHVHALQKVLLAALGLTEVLTRLLGPILIALACVLIGVMTWTYFDAIMPALGFEVLSLRWFATTSFGIYILYSLLFNYTLAVLTPPGTPKDTQAQGGGPDAAEQFASEIGGAGVGNGGAAAPALRDRSLPMDAIEGGEASTASATSAHAPLARRDAASRDSTDPNAFTMCRKCDALRPPRAHHCHVCNRCVLKMDHHCPWLNNCVGFNNYHYFFKVLVYVWAGCIFIAALSVYPFTMGVTFDVDGTAVTPGPGRFVKPPRSPLSRDSRLGLCFVLSCAVGLAVGAMMAWHVYLIATAQTSIEFYQNSSNRARMRHRGLIFRNPYDLGSKRNWEQALGTTTWHWILPTFKGAIGDGRTFPVLR